MCVFFFLFFVLLSVKYEQWKSNSIFTINFLTITTQICHISRNGEWHRFWTSQLSKVPFVAFVLVQIARNCRHWPTIEMCKNWNISSVWVTSMWFTISPSLQADENIDFCLNFDDDGEKYYFSQRSKSASNGVRVHKKLMFAVFIASFSLLSARLAAVAARNQRFVFIHFSCGSRYG